MDVTPLPQSDKGKKMLLAEFTHLIFRPQRLPFIMVTVPDVEQREEIGIGVDKAPMHLPGFFLLLQWKFPWILNRESGGIHQNLTECVVFESFKKHTCYLGLNRETCQLAT